MGQPNSPMQRPVGATAKADPARRSASADPVAAAILLVAGAVGIWQLLLPWRVTAVDPGGSDVGGVSTTGWQVYRFLRAIPDPEFTLRVAMYSVLGVAVGGGALVLLGLSMLLPINHRPLGLAALLIAGLSVLGAIWMLIRARTIFDVGVFSLFAQAQLGWYVFLCAGLLGLLGSWKALATG